MKDLSYRSRPEDLVPRIWPGVETRDGRAGSSCGQIFGGGRSSKSSDLIIDAQAYLTYTLIHA